MLYKKSQSKCYFTYLSTFVFKYYNFFFILRLLQYKREKYYFNIEIFQMKKLGILSVYVRY